jgi:hypothetical protein
MTSRAALENICVLLRRFISGEDRSLNLAGEIEGAIALTFPDDERFEDFLHALATYRPGGGPFLYGEDAMVAKCQAVLSVVESTM